MQSINHSAIKQSNLIWTLPHRRDFPRNRSFRTTGLSTQHPQGFGSPPNSPLMLREIRYTTPSGLPCSMANDTASQLPRKAGIPSYKEGANTPSYNRPATSAFPTWASATVTGTFHALPSVDIAICRSLPDSANLPPGLYSSAICPSGKTHFSPKYPLRTTRTSSWTISTHSNTAKMHNKQLE